jgi:hypothetical protein
MRFKNAAQRKAVMAKINSIVPGKNIAIKMPDGSIEKRTIKHERFGNFVMNTITVKKKVYLLGDGDEYLRGYPIVVPFKQLKKLDRR